MGLMEDLAAPPTKAHTFADWLNRQTPETRKALETAAADTRWTNNALIGLLRKHGASCSRDTITVWRANHGHVVTD
jgi:hypothetical protein